MQRKLLFLLSFLDISGIYASCSAFVREEGQERVVDSIKNGDSFNAVRRNRDGGSEVSTEADKSFQNVGGITTFRNSNEQQRAKVLQRVIRCKNLLQGATDEQMQHAQQEVQKVYEDLSREVSPSPHRQQEYCRPIFKQKVEVDLDKGVTRLTDKLEELYIVKISSNRLRDKVRFEVDKVLVDTHRELFEKYNRWIHTSFLNSPKTVFVKLTLVDQDHFGLEIGGDVYNTCRYTYSYATGIEQSDRLLQIYLGAATIN